jgi:hypothetical protein
MGAAATVTKPKSTPKIDLDEDECENLPLSVYLRKPKESEEAKQRDLFAFAQRYVQAWNEEKARVARIDEEYRAAAKPPGCNYNYNRDMPYLKKRSVSGFLEENAKRLTKREIEDVRDQWSRLATKVKIYKTSDLRGKTVR